MNSFNHNDNSETDELSFTVVFPERLKFHIKRVKKQFYSFMSKKRRENVQKMLQDSRGADRKRRAHWFLVKLHTETAETE